MARKPRPKKEKINLTNKFFDINKFPPEEGMIVFPISMSRISNKSQSAETYFKYMDYINPSKIDKSNSHAKGGAIFVYCDYLYFYSNEKAKGLKSKFMNLMISHKNSFQKLLKGHPSLIFDSFSFKVWNQFYLDSPQFSDYLVKLKRLYKKDRLFQKYLKQDFKTISKGKLNDIQIDFFLEEHLMAYLMTKGQMRLENDFINGKEKWILMAYPGKPLKAHIYLHQLNPFKLENKKNPYQDCWYDLEGKKLYDFNRIDLETYNP